ncbi:MAG: hypothetical protein AAF846_05025 [Chloroflexota bacterium]
MIELKDKMFDIAQKYITKIHHLYNLTPTTFDRAGVSESDNWFGKRKFEYVWIANIKQSDEQPELYLSGAEIIDDGNKTIEFVLIIPKKEEGHAELSFGSYILYDDPIYTALLQTPMILTPSQPISLDQPQLNIYVISWLGITRLFYMGLAEYQSVSKLWQEFFEVLGNLQSVDTEIKAFFDQFPQHYRIVNHYIDDSTSDETSDN